MTARGRATALFRRLLWAVMPLLAAITLAAEDPAAALIERIRAVSRQGVAASADAAAAWKELVARGPAVLPRILEALDTPDTATANWLRTAFDRIVDADRRQGGKGIDADALLRFAQDARRHGRARRLALDVVEELRPGTRDRLVAGWLADPEFRHDAVAHLAQQAEASAKAGRKDEARQLYQKAFAACRDVPQAQTLAARLQALDSPVSLANHFGFLTDWYVIGPFDAAGRKGFMTAYAPEQKIDLAAALPGKSGEVRWKRYHVREAPTAIPARVDLVNLLEPLGRAEDAVAYAYTAFSVPRAGEAEFRGAADDNFTVWVNGRRAFGFEEYRNGVRLDRHRFRARLKAGVNTVLVKVCQSPADPISNEPNWEFLLRVVDPDGNGLAFTSALPEDKQP